MSFAFVAVMSGVGLYGYVTARKRREALQRFAQSKGWSAPRWCEPRRSGQATLSRLAGAG